MKLELGAEPEAKSAHVTGNAPFFVKRNKDVVLT